MSAEEPPKRYTREELETKGLMPEEIDELIKNFVRGRRPHEPSRERSHPPSVLSHDALLSTTCLSMLTLLRAHKTRCTTRERWTPTSRARNTRGCRDGQA